MNNKNRTTQTLAFTASMLIASGLTSLTSMAATQIQPGIEEIQVYRQMPLRDLRLEMNRAQEAMFTVFNDLNSDDRFDIHCDYVKRWQSKIQQYECAPVFLKTARQQEVNFFIRSISGSGPSGEVEGSVGAQGGNGGVPQMDYFNALLEADMKAVFQEYVEYRAAMKEFTTLRDIYEARTSN